MFPLNVIAGSEAVKINLTSQTLTNLDDAPGGSRIISGIRVFSSGQMQRIINWDTAPVYTAINAPTDWNNLKKYINRYEARATSPNTVAFGSPLNTWIACTSSPQWAAQRSSPAAGTTTAVITVEIRQISTGIIKATGVYTCNATQI